MTRDGDVVSRRKTGKHTASEDPGSEAVTTLLGFTLAVLFLTPPSPNESRDLHGMAHPLGNVGDSHDGLGPRQAGVAGRNVSLAPKRGAFRG